MPQSDFCKRSITFDDVVIGKKLHEVIVNNGFIINKKKTRLRPNFVHQEVTGLTVNKFPNVRRKYVRQVRSMLHDWNVSGIANAEKKHFLKYDNKYRHPDLETPSFRQIVKGKIEFLGMVKGKKDPIYRRFIKKYIHLLARDKGIPSLSLSNMDDLGKPQIFVEGKTDKAILITAWRKLYEGLPMQFILKDSNFTTSHRGGSGGAQAVQTILKAHRSDTPHIVLGIFDRDKEGINKYKGLDKDYVDDEKNDWKISLGRKAGAILLPVPDGKEDYEYFDNLCIEFLFSDDVLSMKTEDGKGLTFSYPKAKVLGKEVDDSHSEKIDATRIIKGDKVAFAETIVPSLDSLEFEPFRNLFLQLLNLIAKLKEIDDDLD